jgi:hypothetical protein
LVFAVWIVEPGNPFNLVQTINNMQSAIPINLNFFCLPIVSHFAKEALLLQAK